MSSVYTPDFIIRLDSRAIAKCSKGTAPCVYALGIWIYLVQPSFVTNNLMFGGAVAGISDQQPIMLILISAFVLSLPFEIRGGLDIILV